MNQPALNEAQARLNEKIFWDRLEDMPAVEAVHECRMRRKTLIEMSLVLDDEMRRAAESRDDLRKRRAALLQKEVQRALSVINDKIKEYNLVMDRSSWKEAVREIYGQEGYEACRKWITAQEQWLLQDFAK